ncbi:MAG TPA: SOS response-associated peptidase family protein [Acidobacteriaceae bacterium]|jgi:hypothetical protein
MRWGLVPFWAKDIKVGFSNINAKAEGIENKPAFREAFQRRRCLVPVDNFMSGRRSPLGSIPAVSCPDRISSLVSRGSRYVWPRPPLRTTGSGTVGATFQLGAMFGVGRCDGIEKTSLISLTSEDSVIKTRSIDCQ